MQPSHALAGCALLEAFWREVETAGPNQCWPIIEIAPWKFLFVGKGFAAGSFWRMLVKSTTPLIPSEALDPDVIAVDALSLCRRDYLRPLKVMVSLGDPLISTRP